MVTAGTPDGPTLGRIAYEERLRIKGERLHYAPQPDYDALSDDLRAEWEAAGAVVGATAIARLGQPAELASAMRENVRLRKQLAALEPKAAPGNAEVAYEQWIEHRNPGDVGSRAGFVAGWQAAARLPALVDAHFVGNGPYPLQLVCWTEDASDVECDQTITEVEPGVTWDELEARITAHAAECHAAAAVAAEAQPAPELAAARPRVDWARVSEAVADRERERDRYRELLDEIGVMAANAAEEGDSFGLLEEIAMMIAAADVPDTTPIGEWPDPGNPSAGRTPGAAFPPERHPPGADAGPNYGEAAYLDDEIGGMT